MMNGPFGPRPCTIPGIMPGEDVTRPLTRTYEPNRGGEVILTPEWTQKPDTFGTFRAKEKQLPVDVRTDGTNAERTSIVTGLGRDRGIDENNNPRPFCLPGCGPLVAPPAPPTLLRPAPPFSLFWPHLVGRVEWGMGLAKFEAWFDWRHGTELSVVAETTRVYARYEVTVPPWMDLTCADLPLLNTYKASAAIGYGVARVPATLTKLAQVETLAQTQTLRIPPYARAVSIFPAVPNGVSAQVNAAGTGYTFPLPVDGTQTLLFNGAETITIENTQNAPPGPAYAFLIFELSL